MASSETNDQQNMTSLARKLAWLDGSGAGAKLIKPLVLICVLLGLADFLYHKHPYVQAEYLFNFYGFFGFIAIVMAVIVAKIVQSILSRDETYYKDKSTAAEEYPAAEQDGEASQ